MSKFLEFPQFLMELGRSIQDWKDELKGHLTRNGWRVQAEGNDPYWFEVIPPANQTIGNAVSKEVTRFEFTGTKTSIKTYAAGTAAAMARFNLPFPQYNYENAIDINGVRFTNAPVPDYYEAPRTRATRFFNALRQYQIDNPNSVIASFSVTLSTDPNNAGIGSVYISQTDAAKVPAFANSANIPLEQMQSAYTPGTAAAYSETLSIDHDLASGFVYYVSIHERKVEIATKTTAAFFGPIGVQYTDNAAALAATPEGLSPIEAILYSTGGGLGGAHGVRYSHVWGVAMSNDSGTFNGRHAELYTGVALQAGYPLKDRRVSDNAGRGVATGLGVHESTVPYIVPQSVNILALATLPVVTYDQASNRGLSFFSPGLPMPDVFCMIRDATNESLHLGRIVTDATKLVGITAAGVEVIDASKFPNAGSLIVGTEIIKFTGKAGNVLNGITRAAYGTTQADYGAGVEVYPAMWFVKINGGAMTAGYVKPGEVA